MNNVDRETTVNALPIPSRLIKLIQQGLWPRTEEEERRQNIRSLVPKDRIRIFAPEEDSIYLIKPPFHTVEELRSGRGHKFWLTLAAPEGISPDLSIVIGDFGLGSDSPIVLDYRDDRCNPKVIRLQWSRTDGQPNVWVPCAVSFDEFADILGLE